MGIGKSKIPAAPPGQLLLCVGIPDFDHYYSSLEPLIKTIEKQRIELDIRITDFISSLGAEPVWEVSPDTSLLFKILLTILSILGKGNLSDVAILSKDSPYIQLKTQRIPGKIRRIMTNYNLLLETAEGLYEKLKHSYINESTVQMSENFQKDIARRVIQENYQMKEKLEAIRIVNANRDLIVRMPKELEDMIRVSKEIQVVIRNVVEDSYVQPLMDLIMQRGVQAVAENITTPKEIVKKFWPIV